MPGPATPGTSTCEKTANIVLSATSRTALTRAPPESQLNVYVWPMLVMPVTWPHFTKFTGGRRGGGGKGGGEGGNGDGGGGEGDGGGGEGKGGGGEGNGGGGEGDGGGCGGGLGSGI